MHRFRCPVSRLLLAVTCVVTWAGLASAEVPYWIVSTRRCPQRPGAFGTGSCPLVFRAEPGRPTTPSTMPQLVGSLDPNRPVVVYVHGSYNDTSTTVRDAKRLFQWLSADATSPRQPQFVVFGWPSDAITLVVPSIDVNVLGNRAEFNGYYLARLLSTFPKGSSVTLVGHSHGARVVAAAMHLRGNGVLQGFRLPPMPADGVAVRTVFLAAALDEHWLAPGERYGQAWSAMDGFLHLRNGRDRVLGVYALRRPFARHPLGRVGLDSLARRGVDLPRQNAFEIDVSNRVGEGHLVRDYTQHPDLAHEMRPFVLYDPSLVLHRR